MIQQRIVSELKKNQERLLQSKHVVNDDDTYEGTMFARILVLELFRQFLRRTVQERKITKALTENSIVRKNSCRFALQCFGQKNGFRIKNGFQRNARHQREFDAAIF